MTARKPKAKAAPSPAAVAASFDHKPLARDFTTGTDGRSERGAWQRSDYGLGGYGWNGVSASLVAMQPGGRTAREATLASAIANDIVTGNPTLSTIVDTLLINTLGTGLTLSAKPNATALGIEPDVARALSHQLETHFNIWAATPLECDASGRNNLHDLAVCFLRYVLLSGEGVAALDWRRCSGARTRTKVCILDNRQIDYQSSVTGPNGASVSGVCFDKAGRLTGYMLRDVPIAGVSAAVTRFVDAYTSWGRPKVIHLFTRIDARQVRGMSPLVAALTPAMERETNIEFQMSNGLIQTMFAATITSDLPSHVALGGLAAKEDNDRDYFNDQMAMRETFYGDKKLEFGPGKVTALATGDKFEFKQAKNGNETFGPFNAELLRSAARASGAQVEEISGDYSKTSFSASRMAGELPFRATLKRRKLMETFYRQVFQAWCDEAIETGLVNLPEGAPPYWDNRDAYTTARFLGPGRTEPDRKKYVEAVALELEMGLLTFEDALAERGIDFETQVENIKAERVIMRDAGIDKPIFPGSVTTQIRDNNDRTVPPEDEEND